ncbi:hypothetical protein AB6A40_000730 [Gnathostoma spinigerum]|uniref:PPM-type phosphatase domain-containing protein n=1 Tax=Gnathostoma spinigerum TaxID=75299 RepID=A0ABD6E9G6_9BILA
MASKRKFVAPSLGLFSLYGDLDKGSSSADNKKPSHSGNGDDDLNGVMEKRPKIEGNSASKVCAEENHGAASNLPRLLSVCGWRRGEREDMQDAHILDDQFEVSSSNIKRCAFYAIFDGHAGKRAADFTAKHFPSVLKQKLSSCEDFDAFDKSVKRYFIESYKQIDEQFLTTARREKPSWKDGTTATTVLIFNDAVYCANIGDSRAVVCRSKESDGNVALQLTVDHSPLNFDERMRIQKAGGSVKDGRIMGILEVSRSIGDGQFKKHGVICAPDVKKFCITANDRFMIIACDGLWKTFSNQEAIDYTLSKLEEVEKSTEKEEADGDENLNDFRSQLWEKVAGELAAESVRRGCGDNVSVILVIFDDMSFQSKGKSLK